MVPLRTTLPKNSWSSVSNEFCILVNRKKNNYDEAEEEELEKEGKKEEE